MIGTFAKVGIAMCATMLVAYLAQKRNKQDVKKYYIIEAKKDKEKKDDGIPKFNLEKFKEWL